jgi:hypothetical protein
MNIFFLVMAFFSFVMVVDSWIQYNWQAVIGWASAMILASILSVQDLFERRSKEEQEQEKKRIEAFNKLMNAAE